MNIRRLGLLLLWPLALLCSCSMERPDLQRLYADGAELQDQPPLIIIHGILGAKLKRASGEEVWPGSTLKLIFSDYSDLTYRPDEASLNQAPLQTDGLTDQIVGTDYYRSILEILTSAGRYQPGRIGQKAQAGERRYYVMDYDWRQDNVISANQLGQMIEAIRRDYDNPTLKVDIIAHSMGGLIARYYARYGRQDIVGGQAFMTDFRHLESIRRLALLGTPNLGSVVSLHAFINGLPIGLSRMPTEMLATFPSIFQLFPHPLNNWIIDINGQELSLDLFSVDTWQRLGWSIFNPATRSSMIEAFADPEQGLAHYHQVVRDFTHYLERGRRFAWSLTEPLAEEPHYDTRVFGGDCQLTPARILLEHQADAAMARLQPGQIQHPRRDINYNHLMLEPGDGSVTKASILAKESLNPAIPRHPHSYFNVSGEMFLCEDHSHLGANITFQDNLLNYLLSREMTLNMQQNRQPTLN